MSWKISVLGCEDFGVNNVSKIFALMEAPFEGKGTDKQLMRPALTFLHVLVHALSSS